MISVRVYGIFINQHDQVLVTDEYRLGTFMTKFPGGGLEEGEGTLDCLRRECREELGQEVDILGHFYTTDFFQATLLLPEPRQLISIYYFISLPRPGAIGITTRKFDFSAREGNQSFRLIPLQDIEPEQFTFPIDQHVARKLQGWRETRK